MVREVSAESALEYAAAISPNKNKTPTIMGVLLSMAIAEKSMSGFSKGIECIAAYMYNSAPRCAIIHVRSNTLNSF